MRRIVWMVVAVCALASPASAQFATACEASATFRGSGGDLVWDACTVEFRDGDVFVLAVNNSVGNAAESSFDVTCGSTTLQYRGGASLYRQTSTDLYVGSMPAGACTVRIFFAGRPRAVAAVGAVSSIDLIPFSYYLPGAAGVGVSSFVAYGTFATRSVALFALGLKGPLGDPDPVCGDDTPTVIGRAGTSGGGAQATVTLCTGEASGSLIGSAVWTIERPYAATVTSLPY